MDDGEHRGGSAVERLLRDLVRRAEAEQLLDVAYRVVDGPLGPLLLAATPRGLVRVAFAVEGHEAVLQDLADRVSPRVLHAPGRLDEAARQLDAYLAGRRRAVDVPLDLALARGGFRREVLAALRRIPYGGTATYAQVAAASGSPAAVRAVGTACARNPLPLVVPCHRVVRSDGRAGQYLGGADVKLRLLLLEGARHDRDEGGAPRGARAGGDR
ncbi:methylated-DNA--[protein]-cysteine S-methyltransferase [Kineococcus terrestris]|uniref:methylated-DNA--[protein]-cysteine S-methyltransferase n=1 Tax=Kineococcus terrestris TaxID=2044856 RepID=UPI0035A008FC